METHESVRKRYKSVYEWFFRDLFCESDKDFDLIFKDRLFKDDVDCKKFLADYFNIKIV